MEGRPCCCSTRPGCFSTIPCSPPESANAESAEAESEELVPTAAEVAQELPDDEFDRAANTALEQNQI